MTYTRGKRPPSPSPQLIKQDTIRKNEHVTIFKILKLEKVICSFLKSSLAWLLSVSRRFPSKRIRSATLRSLLLPVIHHLRKPVGLRGQQGGGITKQQKRSKSILHLSFPAVFPSQLLLPHVYGKVGSKSTSSPERLFFCSLILQKPL